MSVPTDSTFCINSLVFVDLKTKVTGIKREAKITELNFCGVGRTHFIEAENKQLPRITNKLHLCIDPSTSIDREEASLSKLDNDMQHFEFDEKVLDTIVHFLDRLQKPICLIAHNGNQFLVLNAQIAQLKKEFLQDIFCSDSVKIFGAVNLSPRPRLPPRLKKKAQKSCGGMSVAPRWDPLLSFKLNDIYQMMCKRKPLDDTEAENNVKMLLLSAIVDSTAFIEKVDIFAVRLLEI